MNQPWKSYEEVEKDNEELSVIKFQLEGELDRTQDAFNELLVKQHFDKKEIK